MDDWFRIIAVVAVAVAVAAGSGVIWLARWTGKHEGWRDAWAEGMEEFKSETRAALGGIREDVKKILVAMPKNVLARTSPVRLTDFGKEVSKSVGAAAWAEEKAPDLVDEIKGKNAYEVQEFCMDHMRGEDSPVTGGRPEGQRLRL